VCGEEVHVKNSGKCCSSQWFEGAVSCPTAVAARGQPTAAGPIKSELPIIASIGLGLMLIILSIGAYLFMKKKSSLRKGKNSEQTATKLATIVGLALLVISIASLTNNNNNNSQTAYATLSLASYQTDNGFYFSSASNNNVTGNVVQSTQTGFTFYSSANNAINGNNACNSGSGFDFISGSANNYGLDNFGKATGETAGNSRFDTQKCQDESSQVLTTVSGPSTSK